MSSASGRAGVGDAEEALREPGRARESTRGGFLACLDIQAADAALFPDAFERIRRGELQAVIVYKVYDPGLLGGVVDRLERHDPGFLQTWFPEKFRAWFYGRNLNLAEPALTGYFDEAAVFDVQLASLFPAGQGLRERVASILAALDGGRRFTAPPGPEQGQHYMFTTLRAHLQEGYIPPHFDNEQALRPSYRHLRSLVDLHMTSFVLTLDMADEGGALQVFDLRCEPEDALPVSDDRVRAKPDTAQLGSVSFRIPPGAMIILDSGRYLHRVSPVLGARKRWTACSFMALSRNGDAMYCWG